MFLFPEIEHSFGTGNEVTIFEGIIPLFINTIKGWGDDFTGMVSGPHGNHIGVGEMESDAFPAVVMVSWMFRIFTSLASLLPHVVPGIFGMESLGSEFGCFRIESGPSHAVRHEAFFIFGVIRFMVDFHTFGMGVIPC